MSSANDFDLGQTLPTRYHQAEFEAEMLVRAAPALRHRIYRPAVVAGDSRTREMDKVDGPYDLFSFVARLRRLPASTPIVLPESESRTRPPDAPEVSV